MKTLITTSKTIAFLSFIIGTTLFATQLYLKESLAIVYLGVIFIIIATIINSISISSGPAVTKKFHFRFRKEVSFELKFIQI